MCQTKVAERSPDGATVDFDAMGSGQFHNQFVEGDLAFVGDAHLDPVGKPRKLAVPAAVALRPRCQRPGIPPQLDQIVHKPRRNPKVPRRFTVPVTLVDERNNALP